MKRFFFAFLVLVLCLTIAGQFALFTKPALAEGNVVTFPDPNLEAAISTSLGKPAGDIHESDLQQMTNLSCGNKNISNITGLEYCINMTYLNITTNQITDISPLAQCTKLENINLEYNLVQDISPLAGLPALYLLYIRGNPLNAHSINDVTPQLEARGVGVDHDPTNSKIVTFHDPKMEEIMRLNTHRIMGNVYASDIEALVHESFGGWGITDISGIEYAVNMDYLEMIDNLISDLTPLAGLSRLPALCLFNNRIIDISPLAKLVNITDIDLSRNYISDLSPLTRLKALTRLDLRENNVSDIKPLVDNTGLGAGVKIDLRGNPLSELSLNTYVPQLEARGVYVHTGPVISPSTGKANPPWAPSWAVPEEPSSSAPAVTETAPASPITTTVTAPVPVPVATVVAVPVTPAVSPESYIVKVGNTTYKIEIVAGWVFISRF